VKEREELFVEQPVKQEDSNARGRDSARFYRGWSVGAGDVCGATRLGSVAFPPSRAWIGRPRERAAVEGGAAGE
jgi:hypothetical protein